MATLATTKTEAKEMASSAIGSGGNILNLLSPAGIFLLPFAAFLDITEFFLEFFLPGPGTYLSAVIDVFACIFFGIWMMFRGGRPKITTSAKARFVKVSKKLKWLKRLKVLRPLIFIVQLLPLPLTAPFPLWSLLVYAEIVYNSD